MHICTVCDHKYMHKGLAMYKSLTNTMRFKFVLHWLCLDDIIYEKLKAIKLPGVVLYNIVSLENESPELRKAKNNPPSKYGDQYSQYCWTCTPFFISYLVLKGLPQLLYVDADIFLYDSPQIIFDVMGDKSVAIHTHRFGGTLESHPKLPDGIGTANDSGWYNVGVMAFRQTPQAHAISIMWKNWLLNPDNPYRENYGTCGDQKYLELFIPLFGAANICVFDKEGPICHKAPWCTEDQYGTIQQGPIPVLFYHFSHFNFDLAAGTWKDYQNEKPEWLPAAQPEIRTLYENYFEVIKEVDTWINA